MAGNSDVCSVSLSCCVVVFAPALVNGGQNQSCVLWCVGVGAWGNHNFLSVSGKQGGMDFLGTAKHTGNWKPGLV